MKVSIIGAGGHSRSLAGLLSRLGYEVNGAYDDNFYDEEYIYPGIQVIGKISDCPTNESLVLAIGDNQTRSRQLLERRNVLPDSLIDKTAVVDKSVLMGFYNQIFPLALINSCTQIGVNNIINSGSIIEHECVIGDHNHIAIGSKLGGRVKIGNSCFIGAGSTVIDSIQICDNVIIGAGAVVVDNISEPGTYVGTPAKKIK